MELDIRLNAYVELASRYMRNSVSLEHAHMVSRGSTDGYYEVAKYEIRERKFQTGWMRFGNIDAGQCIQDRQKSKLTQHPPPTQ